MTDHVIEYRGALLHVRDDGEFRRYAWMQIEGSHVWKGTQNEALELVERLTQMTRGARVVECQP